MTDNDDKKIHKTGWFRSIYYWLNWEYDSDNDKPTEKSVLIKQVCVKQIGLSKLKMNKVIIEPSLAYDLQKIDTSKLKKKEVVTLKKKELATIKEIDIEPILVKPQMSRYSKHRKKNIYD